MKTTAKISIVVAMSVLLAAPALAEEKGKTTDFTLKDLKGEYVRLSDFSDKVLVMSFWAVWCKPCLVELKHLQKIYDKHKKDGFEVLAISMDSPETQAKVKPLVKRYKLTFPVAIDSEKRAVKLYNPKLSAPYSVLFKNGKVIKTREGFQVSDAEVIEKEIADLVKKK